MAENLKGEILSPVGSWEMLEAAVRSGADAVYLGAKDFSARRNAENFDMDELEKAINYCHIRSVKVYLTLNILIKDEELEQAVKLAENAYNVGIDGVIVQDLGLASILHKLLPDLPLHASTQMTVHSPSALPVLKELGFCQVVVSREMSLSELTEFCKQAEKYGMVVEVFVHGALCMCMSGQCLLSAYLGSRSGNRGLCAGPCRLPFAAPKGTGYDLSLKDLSLLEYIGKLYDIGVRSFKIEGRMKRPEYVAAATAACREALYNGTINKELAETLQNVFSRSGFTAGYLENKLGRGMFGIRTKEDVASATKAFPKLHEYYRNERQSVGLSVKFRAVEKEKISLELSDGENTVTVYGEEPLLAKNKAADREGVVKNIDKFGSTPYFAEKIETEISGGLFIRASEINELRRRACEMLSLERSEIKRERANIILGADKPLKTKNTAQKLYIRLEDFAQIPDDLSGVSGVIVPLEKDFDFIKNVENIVDIPRGIVSERAIAERLIVFKQKGFGTALCGNLAALQIAKELGFEIMADTGLNIHNRASAATAGELSAKSVILSNELLIENAAALASPIPKGVISYGNIPLMLFKNCPIKNGRSCDECNKDGVLIDRKGIEFPVRCRMGYSEMLNSVPVWLGDKKNLLTGLDFEVLYFTNESRERVSEVISAYRKGSVPDTKYTRGLFFRGTI